MHYHCAIPQWMRSVKLRIMSVERSVRMVCKTYYLPHLNYTIFYQKLSILIPNFSNLFLAISWSDLHSFSVLLKLQLWQFLSISILHLNLASKKHGSLLFISFSTTLIAKSKASFLGYHIHLLIYSSKFSIAVVFDNY